MPAIHEPMCRVGAAVELHRQHRPLFATYVKDIFYVMERPVLNEHRNKLSRNSTPSASAATSTPAAVNSKVYPKPKFLKLLQSVGAKGKAFQVSEIINYLKEYISSKRLFDQQQPWIVHCENDYLGSVFHCKQFTIDDVRSLLNQNVTVCKSEGIDGNEDESFDSDATEILVSSMSDSDHEPPKKTTPLDDIISSSTSESPKPIFSFSSTDPLLRVNSSFLEILQDVGAKGEVFREKEIFRYLKNYVWSRRLFDPKHPWICLCHNDKLANVFRCNKFLIHDVPHLVAKFGVEYPGYRPTVLRTSSDVPPKTASAIALPLHRHMSSPGRTQSTPSDITSSTADVIAPTFTDHIEEQTSGRSGESVSAATLCRSEESVSAATLCRSGESVSAATLCRSEESVSAATLCRSEESVSAATLCRSGESVSAATLRRSEETVSAATLCRSEERVLAAPSTSEESDLPAALTRGRESDLPAVHRRSRESELPESSSRPTNSFTLTLGMKDEEFLSFQSEEPVDDVYVEYEVMSNSTSFHMSDSEEEHHKVSMDMLVICQDSDIECYADYSDTGSDTDVELSEADKWCCSNCHLYNSPIHRLCDRCWTLRPGWLPDRDKQSSPKPKDSCEHSSKQLQNQIRSSLENLRSKVKGDNSSEDVSSDVSLHSDNLTGLSRPPSPTDDYKTLVKSPNSENAVVKDISCSETLDLRTTLSNICHFTESEVPARRTRNQTRNLKRTLISESDDSDYCSKFPKTSSPVKSIVAPGLCIICLLNPRDASLIHGASGHQICCLSCAKKLKQKGSKCPVCRRTIQKVVRNYLT